MSFDNVLDADNLNRFEPSAPPAAPTLTRADVLTQARVVAAMVSGIAALMEQAALHPRMRHDFIDAWRRWAGTFMAWHFSVERMPVNLEVVRGEAERYRMALEQWRAGLSAELGGHAVVGQQAPVAVKQEKPSGLWANVPWWASASITLGLGWGAYKAVQYVISGWNHRNDDERR